MDGICKLCNQLKDLRDSHIVPRWSHRRLVRVGETTGMPRTIQVFDDTAMVLATQDSEHLLCAECEQRFGLWENAVARVAVQPDDSFPALDRVAVIGAAADGRKIADASTLPDDLIPFALSILWRASVCGLENYRNVSLGARYNEEFRAYLHGETPIPDNVRLLVQLLEPTEPRIDRLIVPPESDAIGAYHRHQFLIFGMYFYVAVGGAGELHLLDEESLDRNRRVSIGTGDFIRRNLALRVTGVQARGAFARDGNR